MVYLIARYVKDIIEVEAQSYGETVWCVQYRVGQDEAVYFLQELNSRFKRLSCDQGSNEKFTAFVDELRTTMENFSKVKTNSYLQTQMVIIGEPEEGNEGVYD